MTKAPFAADDWGMTPAINEAILELARAGALRSVSLITNLPYLSHGLGELASLPGVELALHVNLTLGPSLARPARTFGGLRSLVRDLALGRIDHPWIREEIAAQHEAALAAGARVSLFDGHQHVHLLPPIFRELSAYARGVGKPRLRSVIAAGHPAFFLSQICRRMPAASGLTWEPHSVRRNPGKGFRALVHPALPEKTKGIRHQDGSPALREDDYQFVRSWINKNTSTAGGTDR